MVNVTNQDQLEARISGDRANPFTPGEVIAIYTKEIKDISVSGGFIISGHGIDRANQTSRLVPFLGDLGSKDNFGYLNGTLSAVSNDLPSAYGEQGFVMDNIVESPEGVFHKRRDVLAFDEENILRHVKTPHNQEKIKRFPKPSLPSRSKLQGIRSTSRRKSLIPIWSMQASGIRPKWE